MTRLHCKPRHFAALLLLISIMLCLVGDNPDHALARLESVGWMQVRTLVGREMTTALQQYDVLVSPVAPSSAYLIGEKSSDPLSMYKGDLMTVSLNLAGGQLSLNFVFLGQQIYLRSEGICLLGNKLTSSYI